MSGEGSGVVGTSYTLTCRVSLPSGVEPDSLDIQWLGPSTDEQTVDTTDNRVVTSQLSLDPLSLAHGGDYTCTASYTVDGGTTVTTSDTERVIPISKFSPSNLLALFYPLHINSTSSICGGRNK